MLSPCTTVHISSTQYLSFLLGEQGQFLTRCPLHWAFLSSPLICIHFSSLIVVFASCISSWKFSWRPSATCSTWETRYESGGWIHFLHEELVRGCFTYSDSRDEILEEYTVFDRCDPFLWIHFYSYHPYLEEKELSPAIVRADGGGQWSVCFNTWDSSPLPSPLLGISLSSFCPQWPHTHTSMHWISPRSCLPFWRRKVTSCRCAVWLYFQPVLRTRSKIPGPQILSLWAINQLLDISSIFADI